MDEFLKLPVGIDNFEKIRRNGFYYVDKTSLIEQLFSNWGEVNLFTRPRRFGKTLNMSMLKYFFEIGTDRSLFDGLHISSNEKICSEHMGKYPVIFLSLKNAEGLNFDTAKYQMVELIAREAERFPFLAEDANLSDRDRDKYNALAAFADGRYQMSDDVLYGSLQTLSELLYKHFNQKTVILIDEYDVPLDKAFQHGYYREMVALIRAMFGRALKTNEALAFAVLTGCLRVSKESIFTGLNNFKILSITDSRFDEQFGFTDEEVQRLLADYHLEARFSETKEWYDGYRFGNADVYCAWDVVNYCRDHCKNPNAELKNYWMNTSGNEIINHFVDSLNQPGMLAKRELERLVNGETVVKRVDEMITYKELYTSIDNLWSTMFMTGYLTQHGKEGDGYYRLAIPNREIRNIIIERILKLFRGEVSQNREMFRNFYTALQNANAPVVEKILTEYMTKTISIRDNFVKTVKENFYHGLLIGILGFADDWSVYSNRESGNGFSDIIIEAGYDDDAFGIVMELKWSDDEKSLDQNCRDALEQIDTRQYTQALRNDGYQKILKYGIAFYRKKCRVMVERQ